MSDQRTQEPHATITSKHRRVGRLDSILTEARVEGLMRKALAGGSALALRDFLGQHPQGTDLFDACVHNIAGREGLEGNALVAFVRQCAALERQVFL